MTDVLGTDPEFTELVDADVPRVDLVSAAANGSPGFLLMKQDDRAGLMPPDAIRELIGKTAAPFPPAPAETVTMTGSPAAIFKLIHEAAVAKAKYNAADLKRMANSGAAMADESYPIGDRDDLDRAVRAVGRGGANHDAIRRHVIARAHALGAKSEIPDNWNADGSLKGDVTKETTMDDDALDPMTALAEPDGNASGMDTDPGSPAWEAVDAATARKWTSILARAKGAVDILADRELMEAAAGDEDDAENAWDLQDACCALDYAISVLAPFAVAEQAEADCCDDMQMVGKALAGFDTAALDTVEALGHVRKAGRVLSTANEQAIRGAVDSLQKVLASLPTAPTTEEAGVPVAKTANEEADMAEPTPSADVTEASGQEAAMGVQQANPKPVAGLPVTDVAKANGDKPEMVAVFNANGKLVGIVDPDKITMVSGASADDDSSSADTSSDTGGADTSAPAAPEATDLTPAPAAEAGTPADAVPDDDAVTKSTPDTTLTDMFKSSLLAAVESAFTEHSTSQNTVLAKQGEAVLELAGLVKELKGRIGALEEQPAEPRVFTNGAVPPRDLRGMDRGAAAQVDVAKAREQKDQMYKARNATEQNRIAQDMQADAIAALQAIHQGSARQ
ncbi:hypothetical protein [Streptacidiphilus cavernicola]|uniref:Uncharacterized protein n=1 Tax=Streptacidiphilus cavernicola TaxID=3342716 RepID=A0ABV6VXW0_9ACTN